MLRDGGTQAVDLLCVFQLAPLPKERKQSDFECVTPLTVAKQGAHAAAAVKARPC